MNIVIVAESYPSKGEPSFPFVQQLAYALGNEGHKISIIAPQSVTKAFVRRVPIKPKVSVDVSPEGNKIYVYRPFYISFSNTKIKFCARLAELTFENSVKKGLKCVGNIDAIYCYFWHVGLLTARVSKTIPLFVQASECDITIKSYMRNEKYLKKVKGVVCASSKNLIESIDAGLTLASNCRIAVNGYRPDQFYKMDKYIQREKYGFPKNDFIVAFVGGFIERKGIKELSEALSQMNDVSSIFIGRGNVQPYCSNILFQGPVEHQELVGYLNCADIFVLPTRAEGCCNAIIEALACGLPVISSNKIFNDEILDDTCSIRINEMVVSEIHDAICKLKDNKRLRDKLSVGALIKAKELTIERRGKVISEFIMGRI